MRDRMEDDSEHIFTFAYLMLFSLFLCCVDWRDVEGAFL